MSQNSGPTTKSTPPPLPAPDTPPPLPMPEKEKKSGCNGCLYKFFGGLILLGVFGAVLEEMDPEKEEATQAAPETAVEHAVQLKEIAEKETPESTPSPQASANMTRTPSAPLPAKKSLEDLVEKPLSKKVSIAEGITAAREHLRLIEVSLCDGLFAAAKVNDLVPAFREETQNLERFSERLADTQWWLRKRVEGWRDQAAKKRGCLREASGWEI